MTQFLYPLKQNKKRLSLKGRNSVQNNFIATKKPPAYILYGNKKFTKFQKGQMKTVGGVDYTNSLPLSVTNGQNDGQTHRRSDGRGHKK